MRLTVGVVAALALWGAAGAAFAEDHPYSVTVRSGVGYNFPNNEFGIPIVDESGIDSVITFAAARGPLTASASYLETGSNDEGYSVSLGYGEERCPYFTSIGCEFGVSYRDVGNSNTTSYSLGFSDGIDAWSNDQFKPSWSVGGSATTGDSSESSVSVGLTLPYDFKDRLDDWSVEASVNVVHGFESETTLPDWEVSIGYAITDDLQLSFGYASEVVIDADDEDDLDVERAAFVQLSFSFGS